MDVKYTIYLDVKYVPWHIFDWLEKEMGVFYLSDFNWHWDYSEGPQRLQIDLFDEGLASLIALKWT